MKTTKNLCAALAALALTPFLRAADVYVVATANANAAAPYDTWETAIKGIDEAKAYADTLLAGGADVVTLHLEAGTYKPRNRMMLTNAVHIVGHGADFNKVIIEIDNSGRQAAQKHGVILMDHANAWLENVKVTNGDVRDYGEGSGIRIQGAGGTVTNCHITGNTANGTRKNGGGVAMLCAGALVTHCRIDANQATGNGYDGFGGGVFASAGTLANCLVAGNSSLAGGGIALGGVRGVNTQTPSTARVLNCTVVNNKATASGAGGLYFHGGTPEVVNCLFAGNASTAVADSTGKPEWNANATIPAGTLSYCAFDESAGNPPGDPTCFSFTPSFADEDWRITAGSPLANAGTNYADRAATDLDGNPRLAGPAIDIGCYENQNVAFIVDPVASPTVVLAGADVTFIAQTGNEPVGSDPVFTWTLSALGVADIVFTGRQVTRAMPHPGHYTVTLAATGAEPASRVDYLHVGAHTNYLAAVNSGASPATPYDTWATAATNIHVVLAEAVPGATVLVGPGVYGTTNDIILSNPITLVSSDGYEATTIQNARGDGGGSVSRIVVRMANAQARLEGFTVKNGYARNGKRGGGVCIENQGGVVVACRLTGNHAPGSGISGGGLAILSDLGRAERCLIDANDASGNGTGHGGGVYMTKGILSNCLVISNTASASGGVYAAGGTVVNCTIVGNRQTLASSTAADAAVGGISTESSATVVNCVVAGNTALVAPTEGNHFAPETGGVSASFSHCGVAAPAAAPGTGGISAEDCGFANAADGDWRLRRNSDFYKKGVVQNWMLSATDFAGGPRVTKAGLVDLGCFETPYVPSATIILLF